MSYVTGHTFGDLEQHIDTAEDPALVSTMLHETSVAEDKARVSTSLYDISAAFLNYIYVFRCTNLLGTDSFNFTCNILFVFLKPFLFFNIVNYLRVEMLLKCFNPT